MLFNRCVYFDHLIICKFYENVTNILPLPQHLCDFLFVNNHQLPRPKKIYTEKSQNGDISDDSEPHLNINIRLRLRTEKEILKAANFQKKKITNAELKADFCNFCVIEQIVMTYFPQL